MMPDDVICSLLLATSCKAYCHWSCSSHAERGFTLLIRTRQFKMQEQSRPHEGISVWISQGWTFIPHEDQQGGYRSEMLAWWCEKVNSGEIIFALTIWIMTFAPCAKKPIRSQLRWYLIDWHLYVSESCTIEQKGVCSWSTTKRRRRYFFRKIWRHIPGG